MDVRGIGRRGFLRGAGAVAGGAAAGVLLPEVAQAASAAGAPGPDALFEAGMFAAADRGYARLLERDPGDAHAWAQRGYIALLSNRFVDTARYLGRALALTPGDTVSMSRLADCYVRQDDYARAVPLLTRAGDMIGASLYAAVTGRPYQITGAGPAGVPFVTLDPLPAVTAAVNGVAGTFTVDTGATFTFSADLAKAAGIRAVRTVLVNRGNGPVPTYVGVAGSLRLGGAEIRNVPVMWDDVSFLGATGVIGTPVLYHFLTTMDYAGRALVLDRPGTGSGPGTAPMWLAPDHFIFARGQIGKAGPGPVLIDTGGIGLGVVLTGPQAAQAGIVPDYARPYQDLGATVYPCTARASLGTTARTGLPGAVGPIRPPAEFGFSYLGTLSHEFFKPLSVTFDFAAMTITCRGPRRQGPGPGSYR